MTDPQGFPLTLGDLSAAHGLRDDDPRLLDLTESVNAVVEELTDKADLVDGVVPTSQIPSLSALGLGTAAVADTGTGATNVILGNDSRLSDSRTPSSTLIHAATHSVSGSDPLTLSPAQITGTAVVTGDSRLSDTRTPSALSITDAMIATTLSPSKITGTAVVDNDSRLSDTRVPSALSITDAMIATTLSPSKITGTAVVTSDARLSDTRTPSASSITDDMIASTLSPGKITNTALVATPAAAQTITSAATGHQALILNTLTGQTVAIQEWRVNNAVVSKVSSSGKFQTDIYYALNGAGTHLTLDGTSATFVGNAAGSINTIIKGAASQTADLTQWQNSSGTVLAKIDKDGNLYAPYVLNPTGGSAYSYFRCAVSGVEVGNSSGSTLVGLKVWTAAGQSGDLLKLQVNSVDMASVSAAGLGTFAGLTSTALVSTPASATGSAGLRVPPGTTPTSPTSGDVWMTSGSGLLWRNGAATRTAVAIEGAQTISGAKIFSGAVTLTAAAAGNDVSVLASDSTTATGLAWRQQRLTVPVSSYFYTNVANATGSQIPATPGQGFVWPVPIPHAMTISETRFEVTTAYTAGTTFRVVAYTMHSDGQKPDALIADWGTVAVDSTGIKAITGLATVLPAGLIWLGFVPQTGSAGSGNFRGASVGSVTMSHTASMVANGAMASLCSTGFGTGAAPSTAPAASGWSFVLPVNFEMKRSA